MTVKLVVDHASLKRSLDKLATLDKRMRSRVARKAVNAGATPILKAARRNTPVRTGALRKSLGKKVKGYKGRTTAIIGPRTNYVRQDETHGKVRPSAYAHLAHDGFIAGDARRRGQFIPGVPFITRAATEAKSEAADAMIAKLAEGLEQT